MTQQILANGQNMFPSAREGVPSAGPGSQKYFDTSLQDAATVDVVNKIAAIDVDADEEMAEEEADATSSEETQQPASKQPRPEPPKALFLNFTSDLLPHSSTRKKSKQKKQTAYKVNGVNILNRNDLDSKTVIERIQRRRENHNHVERRRRDNINNTILELSRIVPNALQSGEKPNKGKILKLALDHIQELQNENQRLRQALEMYTNNNHHHQQHNHRHHHHHQQQQPAASAHSASVAAPSQSTEPSLNVIHPPVSMGDNATTDGLSHPDATTTTIIKNSHTSLASQASPSAPSSPAHFSNTNLFPGPSQPQSSSVPSSPQNGPTNSTVMVMPSPALTLPPQMPFNAPPSTPNHQAHRHHHQHHHSATYPGYYSPYPSTSSYFQPAPIQHVPELDGHRSSSSSSSSAASSPAPMLRPILPSPSTKPLSSGPSPFRMGNFEKVYSSTCRY